MSKLSSPVARDNLKEQDANFNWNAEKDGAASKIGLNYIRGANIDIKG